MEPSKFDAWLKKIMATEEEELSCSECFDLISEVVDMEISGVPSGENYKKVKQHLHQCQACMDEYVILRELAQMDAGSQDPLSGEAPESTP